MSPASYRAAPPRVGKNSLPGGHNAVQTRLPAGRAVLKAQGVIIRPATVDDAPGIGVVHVRSWQATYRGHMPDEVLDGLDPQQRAAGWRRYLDAAESQRQALLVADDGGVIGFVSVGASRDADLPESGELFAIYVHPEHLGRGVGRDLMVAGLDALRAHGFTDALLWVLDGNETARAFYESGGWVADGSSKRDESMGFAIDEVRYRIELGT